MSIELAKKLAWGILLNKGKDFDQCRQGMKGFFSRGRPICDDEMLSHLKTVPHIHNMIYDHSVIPRFESCFSQWIQKNSVNKIKGLEQYQADISQGATQAFDSFYNAHFDKRIKMFFGEYLYHVVVNQRLGRPYSFIKDINDLKTGDALVLSYPFCDTGNDISTFDDIMKWCEVKKIPVLLDCAYYTISRDVEIDLNFDCIHTICFSLSKTFPIAHARVGMRYTKKGFKDGQKLHSDINYDNRISAGIGLKFIEKFPSDYVVLKHKQSYNRFVKALGLTSSKTILFADGDDSWKEYGRKDLLDSYGLSHDQDLYHNRISMTELLENNTTTEKILNAID